MIFFYVLKIFAPKFYLKIVIYPPVENETKMTRLWATPKALGHFNHRTLEKVCTR